MKIQDFSPHELLKPYIKTYKFIESENGSMNRVLPDTSIALAFKIKGQTNYISENQIIQIPSIAISGLRKSVRNIQYEKNTSVIIVLFKPLGASMFFSLPLHEFYNDSIAMEHFISKDEIDIIEDKLAFANDNTQQVQIIEKFLLSHLYSTKLDLLVQKSIENIYSSNGNLRIKELAQSLFISSDAFEKRFRKHIGTSPKAFASLVRMRYILTQKNPTLLDKALDGGFFDQAHFNKEFKIFTGQTPSDFYKTPSFW